MFKTATSILILILMIALSSYIFREFHLESEQAPDAISFIPIDAKTIMRCNTSNWPEMQKLNSLLFGKSSDVEIQKLISYQNKLDSLRLTTPVLQEFFNENTVYLSFYNARESKVDWLATCGLKSSQKGEFMKLLKDLFPETKPVSFNDFQIQNGLISYSLVDNIIYVSNNLATLKNGLNAKTQESSILNDPLFAKAYNADGNSEVNIWTKIEQSELNSLKKITESTHRELTGWTSLEPIINDGILQIIGYSFSSNKNARSITEERIKMPWNILIPNKIQTSFQQIGGLDSFEKDWLDKASEEDISAYIAYIQAIENNCECSPLLLSFNHSDYFIKEEIGERSFLILPYSNFSEAIDEYVKLIDGTPTVHQEFPIFRSKYPDLYAQLLHYTKEESYHYFTLIEDHLILSKHKEDLKWHIDEYLNGNTLNGNNSFLNLVNHIAPNNWFHLNNNETEINNLLFPFDLNKNKKGVSFLQLSPEKNKTFLHYAEYAKMEKKEKSISNDENDENEFYQFDLDKLIVSAPQLMTNHYTNEKEILIQDEDHFIHYLSAKGTELWKREIDGKIDGEIKQIDIYKNGKLQMIFNTKNKIYCLDRNGNDVEKYPVNLPSSASSSLAVVDYDKDRKYRILIACDNGILYNYSTQGDPTKGWDYKGSSEAIKQIEHLRIKSKDYLFTLGVKNKVQLLKRNGDIRVKTDQILTDNGTQNVYLMGQSTLESSKMYYINSLGELKSQNLISDKNETIVSGIKKDSGLILEDLNNDNKKDFIITETNQVKTYDSSGEKMGSYSPESSIDIDSKVYKFNKIDKRIGVHSPSTKKIYLIDPKGKEISGFPLKGSFEFAISDIDKDGTFELVSATDYGAVLIYDLD